MSRRGDGAPTTDPDLAPREDERPPYLGSWPLLYAVVFMNLVLLIALFAWFTRAFE